MPTASTEAVTNTWRAESARLIAALTRLTRDVGRAEDLAQDALLAALEQWPVRGIPDNPAAWLMTTAKRRGIDEIRRAETLRRKTDDLGQALRQDQEVSTMSDRPDLSDQVDYIEDDVLRLIFLCCHPTLTPDSRAALTLRMVGGLSTPEIARAFLVADTSMGQRITRAKKTLTQARAEFELPTGSDRVRRLDDVMAVIYLIFNEGYAATSGDDWTRPDLAVEAIRLAGMLAALAPEEPEAHGLYALLEIQGSRIPARHDTDGAPVLLEDQDRSLWDQQMITRGLESLQRAEILAARGAPVGRYYLQAAIASQHARAASPADTDWKRIASLYDVLADAAPGPIVEVNRAVAHGRAFDPGAGLAILEAIGPDALGDSALIPSVHGDLLERSGQSAAASEMFTQAAQRTRNADERALLTERAARNRAAARPR